MTEFLIRPAHEGDLRLIFSAILYSFYKNNRYLREFSDFDQYYQAELNNVTEALGLGAIVHLAVNPDDMNQIFGFVLFNEKRNLIHYLYVKHIYRNMKIGKALLKSTGWHNGDTVRVDHITTYAATISRLYGGKKYKIELEHK